ncbi:hypothetical protein [uncultured Methanospirillum sp.]|uniref:hypothetical protein n=1 Tax=uncultured Methanospirillum sp. TaxID=262503 RepID=UPI0029C85ADA|nr:hypothetical protein [uncultured Methanospirillum sp.]
MSQFPKVMEVTGFPPLPIPPIPFLLDAGTLSYRMTQDQSMTDIVPELRREGTLLPTHFYYFFVNDT